MFGSYSPLQTHLQNNPRYCPDHFSFNADRLLSLKSQFSEDDFLAELELFANCFLEVKEKFEEAVVPIGCRKFHEAIAVASNRLAASEIKTQIEGIKTLNRDQIPRNIFDLFNLKFIPTLSGQMLSPDEFLPMLSDSVEMMLEYANYAFKNNSEDVTDTELKKFNERFNDMFILANSYCAYKSDWERALWLNLRIRPSKGPVPELAFRERAYFIYKANYYRYQSHKFGREIAKSPESPISIIDVFEKAISGEDQNWREIRRSVEKMIAHFATEQTQFLLEEVGIRAIKTNALVAFSDLVFVYTVLRLVCDEVLQNNSEDAARFSFFYRIPFCGLISLLLHIDEATADSLVRSLTFGITGDTIWEAPVIELDQGFAPIVSAMGFAHFDRSIEKLAKLHIANFEHVGKIFERETRKKIYRATQKSNFRRRIHFLHQKEFEYNGKKEEIDLLFVLGSNLVVCELKYICFPTEPREIAACIDVVQSADKQLLRKTFFLQNNISEIEKVFSLPTITNFVNLVVLSYPLFSSLKFKNSIVIDPSLIIDYLENSYTAGLSSADGSPRDLTIDNAFYRDEESFLQNIGAYFLTPPQIALNISGIKERPFYRTSTHFKEGYVLLEPDA